MTPIQYVIVKHILAVLKCPRSIGKLIIYAKAIYDAMKNDAQFAASLPTLTLLDAAIQDLFTKESGFKQKPPLFTSEARNASKVIVKDYLETLRMDVQKVADADKPNAADIVTAAAMHVKVIFIRGKRKNSAENGTEPGEVILEAEGEGAHEWRKSTDNVNWIYIPATLTGTTTATGCEPGAKLYFQNRRILRNGEYGEWSHSIDVRVK